MSSLRAVKLCKTVLVKESTGPNASAVVGNIDKCPWLEPVWSVQPSSSAFWPVARRVSERNQSDGSNGRWIVYKQKRKGKRLMSLLL